MKINKLIEGKIDPEIKISNFKPRDQNNIGPWYLNLIVDCHYFGRVIRKISDANKVEVEGMLDCVNSDIWETVLAKNVS